MKDQNRVEVRIGGKIFAGWKSVVISMSVEQVSRAFAMEVTTDFPGNTDFRALQSGDLCEVYIGEDLVCTGYIESTPVSYDGRRVTVQLQGKSKTIDLVQCCPPSAAYPAPASAAQTPLWADVKGKDGKSHQPEVTSSVGEANSWTNLPAAQIISALAAPYGIKVRASGLGTKLVTHTVNPGETVIKSINRLITKDNLIVTDDAEGNLVIAEIAESSAAVATLKAGENVLSGSAKFDYSKRFSQYVVLGQHTGTDTDFGQTAAADRGIASDSAVRRYRLTVIKDSGQSSNETCGSRAKFEQAYQLAKSQELEYTVQGWRTPRGGLWSMNTCVQVEDTVLGFSGAMVVSGVAFSLKASGMTTKLRLIKPSGLKRTSKGSQQTETSSQTNLWSDVK